MADTSYNVVLRLSTEGSLDARMGDLATRAESAQRSVRGLAISGRDVADVFSRAGERIGGFLESVADKAVSVAEGIGKWGLAAGAALATYGVGKLNNELEQTQISLGAIANAQGFASTFERGFALAGDELAKMKVDVKTLPGDLGQLSDIMKTIATPAAQAHASFDQIRQLAGKTMLTAAILNVPQEVASREMAQLLAGRAGAHNILGTRLGIVGEDAKAFNAESPEKRLARINTEMAKYQGAADRFGMSFVANWTTLKDNIKYVLLAPATAPLFEHVKNSLAGLNTWFDKNTVKIHQLVALVGDKLASAWDSVIGIFERFEPKIMSLVTRIAEMDPSELIAKFVRLAEVIGSIKLAGVGARFAGNALGLAEPAMRFGAGFARSAFGAAQDGEAAAGGPSGLGSVGMLGEIAGAAPVGIALGVLSAAAYGAAAGLKVLATESSAYHRGAVADAKMAAEDLKAIGPAAEGVVDFFTNFSDRVGSGFLRSWHELIANAREYLTGTQRAAPPSVGPLEQRSDSKIPDLPMRENPMDKWQELLDPKKATLRAPSHTPIKVNVEINVTSNQDPGRIARLVADEFKKVSINPKSSPYGVRYDAGRHGG